MHLPRLLRKVLLAMLAVGAMTILIVAVIVLISTLAKRNVDLENARREISRVQQIAMRERLALGDYITFHGGDIRDAPHMTAEELAVAVRREYEEANNHRSEPMSEESRWLMTTLFCLNMVSAQSRVYLYAETRDKARQLQALKATQAKNT